MFHPDNLKGLKIFILVCFLSENNVLYLPVRMKGLPVHPFCSPKKTATGNAEGIAMLQEQNKNKNFASATISRQRF